MTNWKNHKGLQQALKTYLLENEMVLPDTARYESGIDCVCIYISGDRVLIIGLPPLSNYVVRGTEHTNKHLLKAA